MIISDKLAESILKAVFQRDVAQTGLPFADLGITVGASTNLKIALHTGVVAVGDAQTVNEVATANWPAYARLSFANTSTNWAFTSPNQIDNNVAMAYAANNGAGAVVVKWASIGTGTSDRVMFRVPLSLQTPRPFSLLVDANDTIQCYEHGFTGAMEVMFYDLEGSTLPGGITDGTLYYVKTSSVGTHDFQIVTASDGTGTAIALATAGTGVMTGGFVSKVGTKSIGVNDDFKWDATGSNRLTVILR